MSKPQSTAPEPPIEPPPSGHGSTLIWALLACALLVGSSTYRVYQSQRHRLESSYIEESPFPLKSIPQTLGNWKVLAGEERSLDPLTMRITGGTDHVLRTYVDELTGVSLVVLILFGPAEPVTPHTPEVCYPACGYELVGEITDHTIKSAGGLTSQYRSAVYARPNGRTTLREEVYYSFRLAGRWSPDAGVGRKFPRRNPSVFKVQVQRRVAERERRDTDDPIEQFLTLLVPEIEKRIESSRKAEPVSVGGMGPSEPGEASMDRAEGFWFLRSGIQLVAGKRPVNEPTNGTCRVIHENRREADQANQSQDRGQVEGQRPPDDPWDRIRRGRPVVAGPPRALHVLRNFQDLNHRLHSLC